MINKFINLRFGGYTNLQLYDRNHIHDNFEHNYVFYIIILIMSSYLYYDIIIIYNNYIIYITSIYIGYICSSNITSFKINYMKCLYIGVLNYGSYN